MSLDKMTIYVSLLDEGVDVWRPVEAERLANGTFRIMTDDPDPDLERWQFPSGSIVRCEERQLSDGRVLVAVEAARRTG